MRSETYHHTVADILYDKRMEAFQRIREGEDLREHLLILFKPYQDKIAFYLNKRGPIQFRVKGMVIQNPDRVPDSTLKEVFVPAINFMVDLFKKKGVSSILTKSVKTIEIINKLDRRSESGFYHPDQRKIRLVNNGYSKVDWVRKVLIHEIGHHVHMSLLHPLAVRQWDSAWDNIHPWIDKKGSIRGHVFLHADQLDSVGRLVSYNPITKRIGFAENRATQNFENKTLGLKLLKAELKDVLPQLLKLWESVLD